MSTFDFVWLASQSPRRRELLARIGVRAEPLVADPAIDIDEDVEALEHPHAGEDPAVYVERVVAAKLAAALARHARRGLAGAPVLVADTTVALGGRILGKPGGAAEAAAMLADLSGSTHRVLTAVAVARPVAAAPAQTGSATAAEAPGEPAPAAEPGPVRWHARFLRATSVSRVRFARLSRDEIARYVATGEPMDKAGAYAVQGGAGAFVRRIEGSDTGIMGLPLHETARLLERAGVRRR